MTAVILQILFSSLVTAGMWLYTPDLARDDLQARYAGPPSSFVEADGVRLHLRHVRVKPAPQQARRERREPEGARRHLFSGG